MSFRTHFILQFVAKIYKRIYIESESERERERNYYHLPCQEQQQAFQQLWWQRSHGPKALDLGDIAHSSQSKIQTKTSVLTMSLKKSLSTKIILFVNVN